jgi:hypothetical protein
MLVMGRYGCSMIGLSLVKLYCAVLNVMTSVGSC